MFNFIHKIFSMYKPTVYVKNQWIIINQKEVMNRQTKIHSNSEPPSF